MAFHLSTPSPLTLWKWVWDCHRLLFFGQRPHTTTMPKQRPYQQQLGKRFKDYSDKTYGYADTPVSLGTLCLVILGQNLLRTLTPRLLEK